MSNKDMLFGCKLAIVRSIDPTTGLPPGTGGDVAWFETPQQIGMTPQWIEGQSVDLRGGDRLIGTVKEEASLQGVNLSFNEALPDGSALQLLCGGAWDDSTKTYSAPMSKDKHDPVQLEVYTARYAQGVNHSNEADIVGYRKFTFYKASGRVPSFTAQDQNFSTPQMTVGCVENIKANKPSFEWTDVDDLPTP